MEVSSHTSEAVTTHPSENTTTIKDSHSVFRITLAGPSLVVTVLGLIIAVHLLHPSICATLIALVTLQYVVSNDFKAFLSLGPGGTPSTFIGYLKIVYLRLFAISDPFTIPANLEASSTYPATGFFQSQGIDLLPPRRGPRPNIAGIAPQRQLDQHGCPQIHSLLRQALGRCATENPLLLRTGTSCFEKNGIALFGRKFVNRTCNGEICHAHASDKSLHLNLHPLDAKIVLQSGWGQRHPLARGGWLRRYVPPEFVMVYAPRSLEEGVTVAHIVEAAAWWVMGERIQLRLEAVEY